MITITEYNYHNSGHYPSSCILFKTQLKSIGLSVPHRKHITSPLRAQQVNTIYSLWQWYINITITILYFIWNITFRKLILSPWSGRTYSIGPIRQICVLCSETVGSNSMHWAQDSRPLEDGDRIHSRRTYVLSTRQDMGNIQNCGSYINIPWSQTTDSINVLDSYPRRNVFPVRYEQTCRTELSFK
jgi:hypothetical protein